MTQNSSKKPAAKYNPPFHDKKAGDNKKVLPEKLLQDTGLWRASNIDHNVGKGLPTGFSILDEHLSGSGWPESGVTELLYDQGGIGELRLLAPALAHLSQSQSRWLLWVSPPYVPYPPALFQAGIDLASILIVKPKTVKDTLWVLEKALASKSCSAVLAWPGNINERQIRRLQVASKEGNSWNILFRPAEMTKHSSPAELRIQLYPTRAPKLLTHTSIDLKILKRRGGWATDVINVPFTDNLNQTTPIFPELQITDDHTRFNHVAADNFERLFPSEDSYQNTSNNGPEFQ
jgi:hypothetical protein